MHAARLWLLPGLCLWSVACGDDGRATASASDSNNPTLSDPSATHSTDSGGATDSTPTDPGGSATDSQSGTTTVSTSTPSSPSNADDTLTPTDTSDSADTSATDTGFVPHGCDEDPPKGFMAPFDDLCATTPEVGMFNPVVEWHKDTWSMGANSKSSVSAPVVAQLTDDNGDGEITPDDMPEVLLITYNNPDAQTSCWLRAVSGDGLTEVLNVQNVQFSRNQNLSVADIDNDGIVEIVTKARDQKVYAYEHDGALKWTSVALGAHTGAADSTVSISDMNGDGNPELVTGRAILASDGTLIATGTHGIGGAVSMSFAVDVNNDGEQEVVVGNALYNIAGADVWSTAATDGYPGMIDLEVDGLPEIVVVPPNRIRVQRGTDGTVVWDVAIPGGAGGPPTVADFDGDGLPEIGIAGKNRYSVFDSDGTVLWSAVTQDASSGITGSSVYDFEGDGVADVVYADEVNLFVFSGADGAVKLKFTMHNSGTRLEQPVVADVDGDGEVEIVFVSESYGGQFGTVNGVTVLGDADHSWRPGRKIWNQHAYHITNVREDGTIPAVMKNSWQLLNTFRTNSQVENGGLCDPQPQ